MVSLFIFVFTESFLVRSVGSTLKLLSEKCFRIPGRKFQCILSLKCVFIREKVLIFGLLWRSDQGMEIGTLQYNCIFPAQRRSLPREHRSKSVYLLFEKIKDIKLVIFTLIVLLLTYHKNHFAKSFTFS